VESSQREAQAGTASFGWLTGLAAMGFTNVRLVDINVLPYAISGNPEDHDGRAAVDCLRTSPIGPTG